MYDDLHVDPEDSGAQMNPGAKQTKAEKVLPFKPRELKIKLRSISSLIEEEEKINLGSLTASVMKGGDKSADESIMQKPTDG